MLFGLFRRKPDNRLRLLEAMRLRKAYLPDPLTPPEAAALEEAKRRCHACNAKALCDEALATPNAAACALFCPNSHYIAQLKNRSGTFFR